MSTTADTSLDLEPESENGRHYIGPGTWIRDRWYPEEQIGVVSEILDIHDSGTLKIQWYPNGTEYISATMFRGELRRGRYALDKHVDSVSEVLSR